MTAGEVEGGAGSRATRKAADDQLDPSWKRKPSKIKKNPALKRLQDLVAQPSSPKG